MEFNFQTLLDKVWERDEFTVQVSVTKDLKKDRSSHITAVLYFKDSGIASISKQIENDWTMSPNEVLDLMGDTPFADAEIPAIKEALINSGIEVE